MLMIEILFWFFILLLLYTYFGYPRVLHIVAALKKAKPIDKKRIYPAVTIIIPAYNEERSIADKLRNVLELEYPAEKLEIIVVSDVSVDRTDEIVKGFAKQGVKLVRLEQRSGKIKAYRTVVPMAKGEIVIFSDATSLLDRNSVVEMVSNFNDPRVGCVGGLLAYENPKEAIEGKGEHTYWDYERRIRVDESGVASLTSVSGTLYAVYKCLYPLDMKDDLADDLIVPFTVVKNGYKAILEPAALCKEYTVVAADEEISKRSRITIQNLRGLAEYARIMDPLKYGAYAWLVISHKLFRSIVPFFLLTVFLLNGILAPYSVLYGAICLCQVLFYSLGFAGYLLKRAGKLRVVNSIYYFCLSNLAIAVGIFRFFKGRRVATWEPVRT